MEGTNNMTAYRVHILIVVFQNNMIDLDKIKLINLYNILLKQESMMILLQPPINS